jgi:hypothetical protein
MGSFTLSLSQKYAKKITLLRETYYPTLTDEDATKIFIRDCLDVLVPIPELDDPRTKSSTYDLVKNMFMKSMENPV